MVQSILAQNGGFSPFFQAQNSAFKGENPLSKEGFSRSSDSISLNDNPELSAILDRNQGILRTQRIDFLRQQVGELNRQLEILNSLTSNAGIEQAQILRTGIADVGRQLDGVGNNIGVLLETRSQSIEITAIEGQFSQSFNAAATGQGASTLYSQQLQGEFSFYKIAVEEQTSRLALTRDANGNASIAVEQTTTQTEIEVAQINIQSSETLNVKAINPLDALIQDFETAGTLFEELVENSFKAFKIEDGDSNTNSILSFLDKFLSLNKVNIIS